MNVLIIPSWYPTDEKPINGIFIREQAEALSAIHGVRVLYLEVMPRGSRRKPEHMIKQERGYVEEIIEVRNLPLLWQFSYLFHMARALRRVRRTFMPDIAHCHIAVPAGWGAVMLRRFLGVPIVLTENSSEFISWTERPGLRWMARRAFTSANLVIAVSEGQRQRIEQTFNRDKALTIVPNIVDTSKFTPTALPDVQHGYRLLFVGLMDTDQKGVHILLDAIAHIMRTGELGLPLHIDMVGDGSLRAKYEAQARLLGINAMVTFHGLQTHTSIAQMMRECHALVLPSLHEALPLVIIEAMASGRSVISTRCGGPEYMVNESTGLIVEPGQPKQLAQAIVDVVTHLGRYNPQTIAATAEARYSYKAVTHALTELYHKMSRGPRAREEKAPAK